MEPFEYVCIMTSIVLGLAVSRLVSGMAQLLQTRRRTPAYWVHSVWMLNTLVLVIITWWIQYRWRHATEWSLLLCLWMLAAPITYTFAAALLFPNEQEGEPITDWRKHFYGTNRSFFLLLSLTFVIDLVDSLLKGTRYFFELGPAYYCSQIILAALCATGAFTKRSHYHALLAPIFLIYVCALLGSRLLRLM